MSFIIYSFIIMYWFVGICWGINLSRIAISQIKKKQEKQENKGEKRK